MARICHVRESADSKYLLDSKELGRYERYERLVERASLADTRWRMMMIAGFCRLYIPKKVRAKSGLLAKEDDVSRLKSVARPMRKTAL